ncbi:MAG: ATP-binding protein [Thermodesulfobacteriota bacterium]
MARESSQSAHHPFFFSFPSLEQTDFVFRELMDGDDFLILVIGEQGSGKTSLLKRYVAASPELWRPCRIHIRSMENKSRPEGWRHHPVIAQGDAYITKGGRARMVMIDDAHRLVPEAVQSLLLADGSPAGKRRLEKIILFCEPQLLDTLSRIKPSLPDRSGINKLYMPMLTENQTADFLAEWALTGLELQSCKAPVRNRQIKTIYRLSTGLPGKILEEARRMLVKNQCWEARTVFARLVESWRRRRKSAEILTL